MTRINSNIAYYDSAAWEAEQSYANRTKEQDELFELLQAKFNGVFYFQPVLIYVADYFIAEKNLMVFAAWEEHEHGEAYFRELRMQEELEVLGYKVVYYTLDDRNDLGRLIQRWS